MPENEKPPARRVDVYSFLFGVFENPQYEKTKEKIAAAVGKSLFLSVEGIKEKILPLSAYSGLRGVVGNKGKFLKISVYSAFRGVVGSERKIFKICRNSG